MYVVSVLEEMQGGGLMDASLAFHIQNAVNVVLGSIMDGSLDEASRNVDSCVVVRASRVGVGHFRVDVLPLVVTNAVPDVGGELSEGQKDG